ncbi:MAG: 3'-5' exonuclease [Lachnospiraceae bacterium]|nr:3'-5' exonuclease [Lachnospiraceae bacterium]
MTNSYVAVDLETTGLDPKMEKITEIGAIRVRDGVVEKEFHTLVNPRRPLSERIVELTGITDEMVADCPDVGEVIGGFLEFCEGLPLLGHRILFDYSFLKRAAVNSGVEWERDGIDTLVLSRIFMPAEEKKTLPSACRFYGVDTGVSHRALSDAYAAHFLYQTLMERYGEANPERFLEKRLIYKVKREQPASKRQKERLQELLKYHKIEAPVQIDYLSRNEASRLTDQILARYGRM